MTKREHGPAGVDASTEMLETLPARLHKARAHADLSLNEAAEEIGCTYQAVLNWEKGLHTPLPIYVPAIERFIRKHGKPLRVRA